MRLACSGWYGHRGFLVLICISLYFLGHVFSSMNCFLLEFSSFLTNLWKFTRNAIILFCFLILMLLFSHSVMSDSLRPHGLQHTRFPCPSLSPGVCSNLCPLSQWCHWTISFSVAPPSPPALNLSQHQGLFQWVGSSHQVAKVLELQHQTFQWIFRVDFL